MSVTCKEITPPVIYLLVAATGGSYSYVNSRKEMDYRHINILHIGRASGKTSPYKENSQVYVTLNILIPFFLSQFERLSEKHKCDTIRTVAGGMDVRVSH